MRRPPVRQPREHVRRRHRPRLFALHPAHDRPPCLTASCCLLVYPFSLPRENVARTLRSARLWTRVSQSATLKKNTNVLRQQTPHALSERLRAMIDIQTPPQQNSDIPPAFYRDDDVPPPPADDPHWREWWHNYEDDQLSRWIMYGLPALLVVTAALHAVLILIVLTGTPR